MKINTHFIVNLNLHYNFRLNLFKIRFIRIECNYLSRFRHQIVQTQFSIGTGQCLMELEPGRLLDGSLGANHNDHRIAESK